jgi:hypothetical protein
MLSVRLREVLPGLHTMDISSAPSSAAPSSAPSSGPSSVPSLDLTLFVIVCGTTHEILNTDSSTVDMYKSRNNSRENPFWRNKNANETRNILCGVSESTALPIPLPIYTYLPDLWSSLHHHRQNQQPTNRPTNQSNRSLHKKTSMRASPEHAPSQTKPKQTNKPSLLMKLASKKIRKSAIKILK